MKNSLIILSQDSMYSETKSKKKVLHHVVKNTAFNIRYGMKQKLPNGKTFKNARVTCRLLYDLKSRKEVDYIASKPLEYVVLDDNGQDLVVEFRVKVLTTQLEGSHFVIHTQVSFDEEMKFDVESEAIRAVSKPAQIRRLINEKKEKKKELIPEPSKRPRTGDNVLDAVYDMKRVQEEHTAMLNRLQSIISQRQMYSYYPYAYAEPTFSGYPVEAKPVSIPGCSADVSNYYNGDSYAKVKEEVDPETEFVQKMKEMVALYAQLNPGNRKNTLRKVMSSLEDSCPSDVSDFKSALVGDDKTGFDLLPCSSPMQAYDDTFFDDYNNTFSDPFVQNELNSFCIDYLQNGNTSLEY